MLIDAHHDFSTHRPSTYTLTLQGRDEPLDVRGWVVAGTPTTARIYVLLHGIGLSHRSYGRLARELAKSGTVIGVDLPGFGGRRRPKQVVSVAEYAEVVAQLLTLMGVDQYEVIGHSMGAQIALELALIDLARARSLVLVGPVVDSRRRTLFDQAVDLGRDSAKEPPATNLMVLRDYLVCGMRWYLTELRAMITYRTEERIDQLAVPLLVIRGANDPIASSSWCTRLAGAATVGTAVSVAGHRHVVVHTAPKQVAALISEFAAPSGLR